VRTAVFWDIDGTLLTTARAGVFALEAALEEVTGRRIELQDMETAGLTDAAIAASALRTVDVEPSVALVDGFLRAYERQLPAALHRRRGEVMPGVVEILDALSGDADIASFLLTGNTELGARAKLEHYGLLHYFVRGGAFCVGLGPRADIARRALPLAGAGARYVIGDTPHDVQCGNAIEARTIAVATGSYDRAQLEACAPWRVLDRLPHPDTFRELLGSA
jgi:phosphoglycolate phosphatase